MTQSRTNLSSLGLACRKSSLGSSNQLIDNCRLGKRGHVTK